MTPDERYDEIGRRFGNEVLKDRAAESQVNYAKRFLIDARTLIKVESGKAKWQTIRGMAEVLFQLPGTRRKPRGKPHNPLSQERANRIGIKSVAEWVEKGICNLSDPNPEWFVQFLLSSNSETIWGPSELHIPESRVAEELLGTGFRLAFRIREIGPFAALDVQIKKRLDAQFRPPTNLAAQVLDELLRVWDRANKAGTVISEIPLARLVQVSRVKNSLSIVIQPTFYSLFAAMNLAAQQRSVDDLENLPNPLNVIAVLVADKHLFISQRSEKPYERPHCFQASVGGAIYMSDESPMAALKREFMEELGLQVFESQVRFTAMGTNLRTGEPDLLAVVSSEARLDEIMSLYQQRIDKAELQQVMAFPLADEDQIRRSLSTLPFSQDSDRAAVLLALKYHEAARDLREDAL